MKFKAVISLCKKSRFVNIVSNDESSVWWCGNSEALYPMHQVPYLDTEMVRAVFDIPEADVDKWVITTRHNDIYDFSDNVSDENEIMRDKFSFTINRSGKTYKLMRGREGMYLVDCQIFKPIDKSAYIRIYERKSDKGILYLAIKDGMSLVAICTPQIKITNGTVDDLVALLEDAFTL